MKLSQMFPSRFLQAEDLPPNQQEAAMTLTEARAKLAEAGFTLLCVTAEAWRHNWDSSQTEGYVVTVLRPYSHSVRGHSLSALVAAVLADKAVRDAAPEPVDAAVSPADLAEARQRLGDAGGRTAGSVLRVCAGRGGGAPMTVFHEQQPATGVCRECGTPHVVGSCPKQRARNLVQAIGRLNTLRKAYADMARTAGDPDCRASHEAKRDAMQEAINVVIDYTGGHQ